MKHASGVPCGAMDTTPQPYRLGCNMVGLLRKLAVENAAKVQGAPVSSEALTMCGDFHKMSWLCLQPQNTGSGR